MKPTISPAMISENESLYMASSPESVRGSYGVAVIVRVIDVEKLIVYGWTIETRKNADAIANEIETGVATGDRKYRGIGAAFTIFRAGSGNLEIVNRPFRTMYRRGSRLLSFVRMMPDLASAIVDGEQVVSENYRGAKYAGTDPDIDFHYD
jgi:hypothetical protein